MTFIVVIIIIIIIILFPEGKPGMSDAPCLESLGCHLNPHFSLCAVVIYLPPIVLFSLGFSVCVSILPITLLWAD